MSARAVVIVGGGAVGLAAAGFLARGGAEVIVCGRNSQLGLDAASGSAGLITPSHALPLGGPQVLRSVLGWLLGRGMISIRPRPRPGLLRFAALAAAAGRGELQLAGLRALRDQARASLDLFAEMAASGATFEFRRAGMINVCADGAALAAQIEEAELLRGEGLEPRLLDGAELAAVEPALRDDLAGGVLWTEDADADPGLAMAAFADAARRAGARFETGAEVAGFRRDHDGNAVEVLLEGRSMPTRALVLAAGADTPALAAQLGSRLPVEPARGHHLQLPAWPQAPELPLVFGEQAMALSRIGGGLRLTGGMDFAVPDRAVDDGRIADIVRLAGRYLIDPPGAGDLAGATRWCGLRPCTPDGLPICGRLRRAPNTVVATGHGLLGFTLSLATGARRRGSHSRTGFGGGRRTLAAAVPTRSIRGVSDVSSWSESIVCTSEGYYV